jgi:hypothetical protein
MPRVEVRDDNGTGCAVEDECTMCLSERLVLQAVSGMVLDRR